MFKNTTAIRYLTIFAIIAICVLSLFSTSVESVKINYNRNDGHEHHRNIESLELQVSNGASNSVTCPDNSQCPAQNTCCPASDGSYACCPTPNAQCCSDKQHCCPYQFTCGQGGNICKPNSLGFRF